MRDQVNVASAEGRQSLTKGKTVFHGPRFLSVTKKLSIV